MRDYGPTDYRMMSDMHKLLCATTLFLLFACSPEKPSGVSGQAQDAVGGAASGTSQAVLPAGSYSIEIKAIPLDATRKSTIYLAAQGFAPADAKIEWLVNGEPVDGQTALQFKSAEIKKGDKVQARATIKGQEILSNIIEIRNAPPVVRSVKFVPEVLDHGDTLGVEAKGEDIDGDDVSFVYEWTKNGEPAGNGKSIPAALKRGDKINVRITPFDGEAYGRPVLLEREIRNMPPVIIDDKNLKFSFDGKVYTYQVRATDPDGDPLTYSLKSGPAGMTIDPSTGLVRWEVPEDFQGKAAFTVLVSDGQGGETSQKLSVEIKTEKK